MGKLTSNDRVEALKKNLDCFKQQFESMQKKPTRHESQRPPLICTEEAKLNRKLMMVFKIRESPRKKGRTPDRETRRRLNRRE